MYKSEALGLYLSISIFSYFILHCILYFLLHLAATVTRYFSDFTNVACDQFIKHDYGYRLNYIKVPLTC